MQTVKDGCHLTVFYISQPTHKKKKETRWTKRENSRKHSAKYDVKKKQIFPPKQDLNALKNSIFPVFNFILI